MVNRECLRCDGGPLYARDGDAPKCLKCGYVAYYAMDMKAKPQSNCSPAGGGAKTGTPGDTIEPGGDL